MRYDDMIGTVLAQPADQRPAQLAKWRQLVDLLAQRRESAPTEHSASAFNYLRRHREAIPFEVRQDIARSFAGQPVAPELIAFFGEDHPSVAAPLVGSARLAKDEWLELLPAMSPTARALLRHRRDVDASVSQALKSFGASDFVLESGEVAGASLATAHSEAADTAAEATIGARAGETQIRELVARIEAFREEASAKARDAVAPLAQSFRWETGSDGAMIWVDGAPRAPLIGQTIASIAERGQHGVDGQAAGAFEKRAPFRDARFSVAGTGPASGDWRISGIPFFDPLRGSFLGYRGSARRPRIDEVAHREGRDGLFGTDLPADSLRQLIHELRTPLNAIVGFAELIDGEFMGPADETYRARAGVIMSQANRLLAAVDDLDTAARLETRRMSLGETPTDAVALLCRLHDSYQRIAGQRGASIALEFDQHLPAAKVEAEAAERMFARMLAATIGLAGEGEIISASVGTGQVAGRTMLCLAIDRPQAIAGMAEDALLDPGYSPDGDWPGAPALGLGFALRLVRNLAEAAGGLLVVGDTRFYLHLPALEPIERSTHSG